MTKFFISTVLMVMGLGLSAQQELGQVEWLRDYDTAMNQAAASNKLTLILFQEVPGCATCRNYGKNVLSHPLVVDAIEHEFIPLAIYNNVSGADRKILKKYNEPTWNNPVIRIVDSEGKPVMERHAGDYTPAGLVSYMDLALRSAGKGSPRYLQLLKESLNAAKEKTAYYQMYCFWSGEAHLGNQEGVLATEPGFMGGAEVVKVTYDAAVLTKKELDKYAQKASCSVVSKNGATYRIDKDPQYYLKQSAYRHLPLSEIQKTKINSGLKSGIDITDFLSPSQKRWIKEGKKGNENLYELPLFEAWEKMKEK